MGILFARYFMQLSSILSWPAYFGPAVDDDIVLCCQENSYRVSKELFESDLLFGKSLLQRGLDAKYAKGWAVFFAYLEGPSLYHYENVEVFEQLLHCVRLSGSNRWKAALRRIALEIKSTELEDAWKSLQTLNKPDDETIIDAVQNSLAALCLEQGQMQPIAQYGHTVEKLQLELLPAQFASLFPNLCELTITTIRSWNLLGTIYPQNSTLRAITLQLSEHATIPLHVVEGCFGLQQLSVKGSNQSGAPAFFTGVQPFMAPNHLTNLREIVFKTVAIRQGTLGSLCSLPSLETLHLANSYLSPLQELQGLGTSSSLRWLRINDLSSFGTFTHCIDGPLTSLSAMNYGSFLKGALHLLKQKLPQIALEPPHLFTDYRTFAEVILLPDSSPFRPNYLYDLTTVDTVTVSELSALLSMANSEHFSLSAEVGCETDNATINNGYPSNVYAPYDYNRVTSVGPYLNASICKGPDGRKRIACQEPRTPQARAHFWQMVEKENVSLIVMVKEAGEPYFPFNNAKIAVTILEERTETFFTFRRLQVNQKEVCHLQVKWDDNQGIDPVVFNTVLETVMPLEKNQQESTLIHCAAGVGRTGTFLAGIYLKYLLKSQPKVALFNLKALLLGMRQQRMFMVIATAQLICLLKLFKLIQSAK